MLISACRHNFAAVHIAMHACLIIPSDAQNLKYVLFDCTSYKYCSAQSKISFKLEAQLAKKGLANTNILCRDQCSCFGCFGPPGKSGEEGRQGLPGDRTGR